MVDVVSPQTVEWVCAVYGAQVVSADGGGIPDGDLAYRISAFGGDASIVHVTERGGPEEEVLRGRREYVERWLVWTAGSRQHANRAIWEGPSAPGWTVAPGGPLSLRRTDREIEVVARNEVIMSFRHDRPVEFTHYGYLPVELLVSEIEKPPGESVFHLEPPRNYRRGWERRFQRRNRDVPDRIRAWAVEQMAARDAASRRALGAKEEDA